MTDKRLLTAEEQDNCWPSKEQLEAYLVEPDDAMAKRLSLKDKRLVAKVILYGENVAKAQLAKVDKVCPECGDSGRGKPTLQEPDGAEGSCPTCQGEVDRDRPKLREAISKMEFYPQLLGTFEGGHSHLSPFAIKQIIAFFPDEKKHQAEILKLSRHIATRSGQIAALKKKLEQAKREEMERILSLITNKGLKAFLKECERELDTKCFGKP